MPNTFAQRTFNPGGGGTPTLGVIVLAVADNANNTGATATITGSSGGVNTVWTQPALLPGQAFASTGTRTGDGTVALALPIGTYWGYCSSLLASAISESNMVLFNVTGGGGRIYTQIVSATVIQVTLLNLQIDGNTVPVVLRNSLQTDGDPVVPRLAIIAKGGERAERLWGNTWMVDYSVLVALEWEQRAEITGSIPGELETNLDWRVVLAAALKVPATLGLASITYVEVDYDPVLDEGQLRKGVGRSVVAFRFRAMQDF